ncbi:MAG: hypothetical protein EXS03_03545 [Phycisphaerales bacterium]|nr:hypothetical protein [Phycisphaerales bacterium]
MGGDPASIQAVLAAAHADNSVGWAKPVDVMMFQEVTGSTVGTLQSLIDAAAPSGATYARATFTTSGNEDSASGAQCAFYRIQTISETVASHADISTGASRNADRWLFRLNGYTSGAASFYVYSMHLKASLGYEDVRETGALAVRANANALGVGVRAIYLGDFNVYINTEPAYLAFIASGNGQAFDGLGTGSWAGVANAWKHTQSPRLASTGLIGGGMDDRFDIHLATAALTDGEGIAQIPGAYRAFGNDGDHFDTDINAGNNSFYPSDIARSNALADALREASDHIPVIVDYQVPAVASAVMGVVPPRVIQGASASAQVTIKNMATVATPLGSDELDYSVAGSGGFVGTATGVAPLAPALATVNLAMATTSVGSFSPQALVTTSSEAAQNPSIALSSAFTVVAKSRPSWRVDAVATTGSFAVGINPNATLEVDIPLFNYGYSANQSKLDADFWSTPFGSPVQVVGSLPLAIGANPGAIRIRVNSAGLPSGLTIVNATLLTSDENVPGESDASLSLAIGITVAGPPPQPEDFNGDGAVNASDLSVLLAQWGGPGQADLNGSGTVDGIDLGMLLSNWG